MNFTLNYKQFSKAEDVIHRFNYKSVNDSLFDIHVFSDLSFAICFYQSYICISDDNFATFGNWEDGYHNHAKISLNSIDDYNLFNSFFVILGSMKMILIV